MNETIIESLYYFYRILTLHYKKEIKNSSDFLDYIYNMDIMHLRCYCKPYLWEDYIFIDDELIYDFIQKIKINTKFEEHEFDYLSQFDEECLDRIINNGLLIRKKMNHQDYLLTEDIDEISSKWRIEYYYESKINHLYFTNSDYEKKLISKKRNLQIDKIIT